MSVITEAREIRTPGELARLLRELKQAVGAGDLVQLRLDPSCYATEVAIADLGDEGPWPDDIELSFRARGAGQVYTLSVDTYHGRGGTWGPQSPPG